ncbi:hypothetical protein LSH36_577g03088 [Paralvinella palmiformis]|uniref:Uncharacterized protein n=1 Tax=Paralvinella palmiformis TaxID=53620 RepID=A0AAD9J6W8_9ANNE|nr:hypothetical protein LSH36_577g03088 [Paralvinella palmiformis]
MGHGAGDIGSDHLVEGKQKELVGRKERESKRRSLDLDNRLKQSKENKQKLDEDIQRWHEELLLYRQQQERRAEEMAKQRVTEKARRAHEERLAKERLQKENMKKLLSAEDEWKAEVEATIALKDSKSKMIQREKEEIIQQSRAMAHAAQLLREELKQHYSLSDLDKLNQQAELEAKLSMRTLPSASSSMAKLNLDN